MSSASTKFFDEIAKLFSGAAGMAQGLREEIDNLVKSQMERLIADMELVRREEFEVVKEMAARARAEADGLKVKVAELEAEIDRLKKAQ